MVFFMCCSRLKSSWMSGWTNVGRGNVITLEFLILLFQENNFLRGYKLKICLNKMLKHSHVEQPRQLILPAAKALLWKIVSHFKGSPNIIPFPFFFPHPIHLERSSLPFTSLTFFIYVYPINWKADLARRVRKVWPL